MTSIDFFCQYIWCPSLLDYLEHTYHLDFEKVTYRVLRCWNQFRFPFIVNPPHSEHLPRIANCRWCACAGQIGQIFFHNRIYINLVRHI